MEGGKLGLCEFLDRQLLRTFFHPLFSHSFPLSKSPFLPGNNGGQFMEERNNAQVFEHPNYSSSSLDNDFALLKLDSPVTSITPVSMDQNQYSPNYGSSKYS